MGAGFPFLPGHPIFRGLHPTPPSAPAMLLPTCLLPRSLRPHPFARTGVLPFWVLLSALGACGGDAPAALEVGSEIRFPERELTGLTEARRLELATLSGVALAVSRAETGRLGEPLLLRQERELLIEALVDEETLRAGGVGDDVLRARYSVSPALQLEVRHFVILAERTAADTTRARARATAEAGLERARAGEDFAALAGALSEEPGADRRGGLLRPAREGDWVPEFWTAAASLQPGEISGVVESTYGFHVLQLESRETVPFADVRPQVAREVAGLMGRLERDAARAALVEGASEGVVIPDGAEERIRSGTTSPTELITSWPGGGLRVEGFARWLGGRAGRERVDVGAATDPEVAAALREAAIEQRLVDRALDEGLRAGDEDLAAFLRLWEARIARWSQLFGFRAGAGPDAIRESARRALGASGQEEALARQEIFDHRALVEALYPIRAAGMQ